MFINVFEGRKPKRSKVAFPYDKANHVHDGLEERKKEKNRNKKTNRIWGKAQ